jgi:gamma-glutamylcyclotransferase (GGCT)/AIG2-like uncharacterized protein YtfP
MPLVFSYGSLQQENVQLSTLGRRLDGERDELVGYEQSVVMIDDPQVAATVGKTHHANVTFSGDEGSRVPGMVFEITDSELAGLDAYEAADSYARVASGLASGRQAWVYVHAPAASNRKIFPAMLIAFVLSQPPAVLQLTDGASWQSFARWFPPCR